MKEHPQPRLPGQAHTRYLRSEVNSAMAAMWRCCLADHGSETGVSAVTKGLLSVQSWKSRPCLTCLMAATAAISSRSNVEYFDSASCSLREKKPNGCQEPRTCWWSAPPMWVLDASIAKAMAALGAGCASGTAVVSTFLLHRNGLSRAGVHSSVFLPPLRVVVSSSRTPAIPGMKRR